MLFSFIIPIYNRPDEVEELLQSLTTLVTSTPFEVIIIEDGSSLRCHTIVEKFTKKLTIIYHYKENGGPGKARNFGMKKANGTYFIILDSDCIVPKYYLKEVTKSLEKEWVDCFGGPDNAHHSFSKLQKAINFSMTSFLTTGGIRGGSEKIDKFQPRSFNMGLSKKAFEKSGGFGNIHPGEDPDLSLRLWQLGFSTKLIPTAFVYHKRRISWQKFYTQVNKFGKVRPILTTWHPNTNKITYWLPTFFIIGGLLSILFAVFGYTLPLFCYLGYFVILFIHSLLKNKNCTIALYSVMATIIQFYGYGSGFLQSFIQITLLKRKPKKVFPELFFN